MLKKTKIRLNPKWIPNQKIKYKIYRKDFFTYLEKQRYPIENSYELHLTVQKKKKEKIEIEAYYPFGYLYLLTSFQPFSSLIGKEELFKSPEGNRFKYLINKNGSIDKMIELKNIKKELKIIELSIRNSDLKKKEKKRILSDLSYIVKSKKEIKNYLSRDIELIHRLYGNIISLNYFYDNQSSIDEEEFEEEINKLKGKDYKFFRSLNYDYHELDFVNTFQSGKELVVDEISGLNLISVGIEDRHDLSQIREDYLNNNFKIEEYNNITLHQKTSNFNLKKRYLKSYTHTRRTVSKKMQKIEEVKIKMIKKKRV